MCIVSLNAGPSDDDSVWLAIASDELQANCGYYLKAFSYQLTCLFDPIVKLFNFAG